MDGGTAAIARPIRACRLGLAGAVSVVVGIAFFGVVLIGAEGECQNAGEGMRLGWKGNQGSRT